MLARTFVQVSLGQKVLS